VVEAVALNCLLTGRWKLWIEAFAPSFSFVVRHAYIDISVTCAERRRPVAVSPFRSFLCVRDLLWVSIEFAFPVEYSASPVEGFLRGIGLVASSGAISSEAVG
jgi:hypothetical protein